MNSSSIAKRSLLYVFLLFLNTVTTQVNYFPEQNEAWIEKAPSDLNVGSQWLNNAVTFAKNNEYSGSRDLRIAILKGFEREPFHQILGPTKRRGGPAGLILKDG